MLNDRSMTRSQRKIGIQQVLASGLCFGCLGLLGKLIYARGVSPGEVLTLRFSLASSMLFAWQLWRNPKSLMISPKTLLTCAGLGIFGYACFAFCFFSALGGLSTSA